MCAFVYQQQQQQQLQLEESSEALEAASRLSEQLDRKEEMVSALREEGWCSLDARACVWWYTPVRGRDRSQLRSGDGEGNLYIILSLLHLNLQNYQSNPIHNVNFFIIRQITCA